ncbi:FRG domain-containing protein [Massilia sp. CMS3.1]|uniref:FRG domain-containing protein n=1 Tax=Massilia sp. CMS3.1 TaxID=3373083 RepID=UPI003EE7AF77
MDKDAAKKYFENDRDRASGVKEIEVDCLWEADNPQQALSWLRWHLYWPATIADATEISGASQLRIQHRAFFRGHGDAQWQLMPSLHRLQGAEQLKAAAATRLATQVIKVEFDLLWSRDGTQAWPPLASHSAIAAAQHYQFATTLLDWSASPAVAVHFATCRNEDKISPQASVHWFTSGDAEDLGIKFVLPPIYVERLYRQRGIFTDMTPEISKTLESKAKKIVFPGWPKLSVLFTENGSQTFEAELMPSDAWFENLRRWSIENAGGTMQDWPAEMLNLDFIRQYGHHPAVLDFSEIQAMFEGGIQALPMVAFIDEFARRINRFGTCYDPRVLDLIERNNSELLHWFRKIGVTFPKCGKTVQPLP